MFVLLPGVLTTKEGVFLTPFLEGAPPEGGAFVNENDSGGCSNAPNGCLGVSDGVLSTYEVLWEEGASPSSEAKALVGEAMFTWAERGAG